MSSSPDRVARGRLLQLRDGHDVAGARLGHVDVLLALREEEAGKALGDAARRVPVGAVGLEVAGAHAHVGDPPGEGIRDGLEHLRHRVVLLVAEDPDGFAVLARPLDDAPFRGGEKRDARVEDPLGPDPESRGSAEDRKELPRGDLLAQSRQDVGGFQRALREELFHQLVFALGDHLDQVLMLRPGPLEELLGNRSIGALARLVPVRLHADEVHGAGKRLLLADGDLERDDAPPELLAKRLHRAVEGSAFAVHPVDDEEDRAPELLGELPGLFRLDLHARDGVADDQGRVGRCHGCAGLGREDPVTRGVREVHARVSVNGVRHGEVDRDLPFDLFRVEIRWAGAFFDPAGARRGPCGVEHGSDQSRFSDRVVAGHSHISNLGGGEDFHGRGLY